MKLGNTKNYLFSIGAALFVLTGTYNAVVINSESHISGSDVKFVKRLDEIYGVTVQGREVAATVSWQKLKAAPVIAKKPVEVIQTVSKVEAAPQVAAQEESAPAVAAVQEDLTLSLTEVINEKKWQKGLTNTQFMGSLVTNHGIIESLDVALPNGEGLSVSFSEMTGNVFEYDMNGELFSGMMYQVDQNAYMVTLTNGPLEGTRLRFSTAAPLEEQQYVQDQLAENNVEVGNFGNDPAHQEQSVYAQAEEVNPELMNEQDRLMQEQAAQGGQYNPNAAL